MSLELPNIMDAANEFDMHIILDLCAYIYAMNMNVVQCDAVGLDSMISLTRFTLELSISGLDHFSSHLNQ